MTREFAPVRRWITLLAYGLTVGLVACTDQGVERDTTFNGATVVVHESAFDDPTVVAVVGDQQMSIADVKGYIADRPLPRGTSAVAEGVARAVEDMITAEALHQKALQYGLDRVPEVQRAIRQLLIQGLLDEQVTKPVVGRPIQDAELKAYFEQHRGEYAWPEQVRLADIYIALPEGAASSERGTRRQRAEAVLEAVREARGRRFGFSKLVRNYSDEHPKFSPGDTGFFDRDGQPVGLDPELVRAAFTLERNGELYDGVVETGSGYHVIMRVGFRSANLKSYKDVADELTQRIRREELAEKRRSYISSVRAGTRVRINERTIAALATELGGAAVDPPARDATGTAGKGGATPPMLSVEGE